MKHLLSLCLFLMFTAGSFADTLPGSEHSCSLELTPEDAMHLQENIDAGLYDAPAGRVTGTYKIPLAFHIVRTTAGTGGIPQSQLDQAMIDLADAYLGTGMCFWIAYQDTINSSAYYSIGSDAERSALKAINNQPNAIDCYFVDYDGGYCGVSSFTWSADQGITLDNGCVGLASNPSTFPHEIGHYFDLLHTHEPFYGNECPDGSNCGSAGDLVCDTPADPNVSGQVNGSCNYTGSATIFCNGATRAYNPDATNLMSYSTKTCRTNFSAGQASRMISTLTNLRWGEVGFNAADFDAPTPGGWSNSLVPRNTTGGTAGSTVVTATLPGNVSNATYLNMATRQANSNVYFPGLYSRIFLDNSWVWWYSYSGTNWNTTAYYQDFGSITVRGGRHSTHVELDYHDEVCETNENDNRDYSQWIWSPLDLNVDDQLTRNAPPQKMTGTYTYPNNDGFQFSHVSGSWWYGVAIQPESATADFDVTLHNDYTGSTAGYGSSLVTSAWGSGQPDWALVNRNVVSSGTYQAGVFNFDGETPGYRLNRVDSNILSSPFDGARYCGEMADGQILSVSELYLTAGSEWDIQLLSETTVDIDLYFYDRTTEYASHGNYDALSYTTGSPNEMVSFPVVETGWHAIAVARRGFADIDGVVNYELRLTRAEDKLIIERPVDPVVSVFQDNDPWNSSEWRDQLDAAGIAYTVYPTADLAALDPYAHDVIIVPSQTLSPAYSNVLAAAHTGLADFNDRGGVLVLSSCWSSSGGNGDLHFDNIQNDWATCNTATTSHHFLTTGASLTDAPGNNAVHYTYSNIPAGWLQLAWSGCDGAPTFLFNQDRGVVLYGAPMEHGAEHFNCSLGESIENIVAWAMQRAQQTVRLRSDGAVFNQTLNYINLSPGNITMTQTESNPWLDASPDNSIIFSNSVLPASFQANTNGLAAGIYSDVVTVEHFLQNTPETIHTFLDFEGPRQPVAPIVVDIYPVDFTPGNATVHVSYDPVTTDIYGDPVVVDYYILYYDDDWLFGSAGSEGTTQTDLDLYYHNVGMLEMGFLRVTAVDEDGMVVADSHPDLPLPVQALPGNQGFIGQAEVEADEIK